MAAPVKNNLTIFIDPSNSTKEPLENGATFTGDWVEASLPAVNMAIATDQNCTYKIQFSPDGSNIDSTLTFYYRVGVIEQPKRIVATRQYYRILIENDSGSNQSYLRFQTMLGNFNILSTPLNGVITGDHGSIVVRNLPFEIEAGIGRYASYEAVDKFGQNDNISNSGNEDVWDGGGLFACFPTGSPENIEIVLSAAGDVGGKATFKYLATSSSTEWAETTITTASQAHDSGISAYRVKEIEWDGTDAATPGINAGTVTLRHITTTANIFTVISIGRGHSRVAGSTVPQDHRAILRKIEISINKSQTANLKGALWVRPSGKTAQYRHPFTATNTSPHEDSIPTGIILEAGTDFGLHIETCSANSTEVFGDLQYILVHDADYVP